MHTLRNTLLRATALVLLACATGCTSINPRYQVSVGNAHDQLYVHDVTVEMDGKDAASFEKISPKKTAGIKPRKGTLPETIRVTWTDSAGTVHAKAVDVTVDRERFSGLLVCEIDMSNSLVLAPVEALEEDFGVIPWAAPESWEGTIGVPGLE